MAVPTLSQRAIDEWLDFAIELANSAHAVLSAAGHVRPDAVVKPDKSFVTALDSDIEAQLRTKIETRFPSHGILGEEWGVSQPDAEVVWVLDPIDGTAPFIAGVPVYGTLISVTVGGTPVIGIIDMAATADRWIGVVGRPARHNGEPCHTRNCSELTQAILTTSNPDFFSTDERPVLDALRNTTAWRIYGGCCMSYGLLASGRTDVAIDTGFKIYDFAPFVPIITGAGGAISDWEGRPLSLTSGPRILAAGDRTLHRKALAVVERRK